MATYIFLLSVLTLVAHVAIAKLILPDVFEENSNDLLDYDDFANNQKREDPLLQVENSEDLLSAYKRMDANQFFHMRGRRNGGDLEGDSSLVDEQNPESLLRLARYLRYLHNRRDSLSSGTPSKRQPPQGFHAVRGKRSVSNISH